MPRFPLALKALSRKCLRESLAGGSVVSRFKLKLGNDMFHREAFRFFLEWESAMPLLTQFALFFISPLGDRKRYWAI
jgi:hypothetical protein